MKHIGSILTILLLVSLLFSACTPEESSSQMPETSDDSNQDSAPMDNIQVSIPVFFNDLGKTLSVLKDEHPEAEFMVGLEAFPDAAAACFGEPEAQYAYLFFGGHSGDFEFAMDEYKDQLQCAGFVTNAGILFPEMEDDMSFVDFFSLIGVSDYTYFAKGDNSVAQGWLEFKYHDMDVWLNANNPTVGYWDFTDVDRVKSSASVSIADKELYHQNQELADSIMFNKIWPAEDWVYEDDQSFSDTYNLEDEDWTFDTPFYDIDVKLPFINMHSEDAEAVNTIMSTHLAEVNSWRTESLAHVQAGDWGGWWFTYYISYASSLNNDILSLCIRIETSGTDVPYVYYETFNFNILNGKLLTQEELLTTFGLTSKALDNAAQQAIQAEVEHFNNEYNHAEYIETDIDDTIEEYNSIKEEQALQFYVDTTGELYLYLDVSNYYIGRGWRGVLLPLNF